MRSTILLCMCILAINGYGKKYKVNKEGSTIDLSSTWSKRQIHKSLGDYQFVNIFKMTYMAAIELKTVMKDETAVTANMDETLQGVKSTVTKFKIDSQRFVEKNGLLMKEAKFTATAQGIDFYYIVVIIGRDGLFSQISAWATKDKKNTLTKEMSKIITSFQMPAATSKWAKSASFVRENFNIPNYKLSIKYKPSEFKKGDEPDAALSLLSAPEDVVVYFYDYQLDEDESFEEVIVPFMRESYKDVKLIKSGKKKMNGYDSEYIKLKSDKNNVYISEYLIKFDKKQALEARIITEGQKNPEIILREMLKTLKVEKLKASIKLPEAKKDSIIKNYSKYDQDLLKKVKLKHSFKTWNLGNLSNKDLIFSKHILYDLSSGKQQKIYNDQEEETSSWAKAENKYFAIKNDKIVELENGKLNELGQKASLITDYKDGLITLNNKTDKLSITKTQEYGSIVYQYYDIGIYVNNTYKKLTTIDTYPNYIKYDISSDKIVIASYYPARLYFYNFKTKAITKTDWNTLSGIAYFEGKMLIKGRQSSSEPIGVYLIENNKKSLIIKGNTWSPYHIEKGSYYLTSSILPKMTDYGTRNIYEINKKDLPQIKNSKTINEEQFKKIAKTIFSKVKLLNQKKTINLINQQTLEECKKIGVQLPATDDDWDSFMVEYSDITVDVMKLFIAISIQRLLDENCEMVESEDEIEVFGTLEQKANLYSISTNPAYHVYTLRFSDSGSDGVLVSIKENASGRKIIIDCQGKAQIDTTNRTKEIAQKPVDAILKLLVQNKKNTHLKKAVLQYLEAMNQKEKLVALSKLMKNNQFKSEFDRLVILKCEFEDSKNPSSLIPSIMTLLKEFPNNKSLLRLLGRAYESENSLQSKKKALFCYEKVIEDVEYPEYSYEDLLTKIEELKKEIAK